MKEVLHLFGVSEKVIPKVDLQISYLPQSHISPTHPFDLPTHPRGGGVKNVSSGLLGRKLHFPDPPFYLPTLWGGVVKCKAKLLHVFAPSAAWGG